MISMSKLKKVLKKIYIKSTQKVAHLRKTVDCNSEWYGGEYAGFYVFPDILNEQSIVYSIGIGRDISFDTAIMDKHKCKVFAFDPTPKSIDWIKSQILPNNFHFNEFGIGPKTEDTVFYLPVNDEHISGSLEKHSNVAENRSVKVHIKSLKDIANHLGHKHIDVLKMDIEGSEYDIIESILNSDLIIDQILIEFHDRFFKDEIPKSVTSINKLREKGYEIFAVSDLYEEVSFIRKPALEQFSRA